MNCLRDFDFQSQYNINSKNVCIGCIMEEQVKKVKLYHLAKLQVFVTFSSTQSPQKICQTTIFNSSTFLNQWVYIENSEYQIECTSTSLEELQRLLIEYFQKQQKPIDEVRLILDSI